MPLRIALSQTRGFARLQQQSHSMNDQIPVYSKIPQPDTPRSGSMTHDGRNASKHGSASPKGKKSPVPVENGSSSRKDSPQPLRERRNVNMSNINVGNRDLPKEDAIRDEEDNTNVDVKGESPAISPKSTKGDEGAALPGNERVTVALRIRPFTSEETKAHGRKAIAVFGNRVLVCEDIVPAESPKGRAKKDIDSPRAANHEFSLDFVQDDNLTPPTDPAMIDNLQSRLFEVLGSPCLKAALEGYNATVFAYGQTGSGKTYTMMGDGTSAGKGMVPRIASALLQRMTYLYHGDPECHIQVSFLEIYQEKIRDLLTNKHPGHTGTNASDAFASPSRSEQRRPAPQAPEETANKESNVCGSSQSPAQPFQDSKAFSDQPPKKQAKRFAESAPPSPTSPRTPASPRSPRSPRSPSISPLSSPNGGLEKLKIREHPKLGPYVVGLTRRFVTTWEEMKDALSEGQSHRTFGATDMNKKSSRSHTVFTMTITQKVKGQDGLDSQRTSQLNMVDLAGSERQARTHASGQRLKESGYINRSLSLLNNVITQLSQGSDFVPYRNSVLTWLLKESLGGNSKTVMIANISPAIEDLRETLSTLRYANRAKRIQNKPTINEDPKDLTIRCLMSEVKTLRKMVESLALRASFQPLVRLRSVGVQVPECPQQEGSCLAIKLPLKRDSFAFRDPSSAVLALPFTPLFPSPFPRSRALLTSTSHSEPVKRRSSGIERAPSFGTTSHEKLKAGGLPAPLPDKENASPLLLEQGGTTAEADKGKPFIFGEPSAAKDASPPKPHPLTMALESQTDTLIKKLTNVLRKPGVLSSSTKTASPDFTRAAYPFFVQLTPASDEDAKADAASCSKHILQPGVTKVGSGNGADIHVSGLLEEHCEVLHIPGRQNASGHTTTTRVSILIYGNALASVDGRPLQRYAVLEHGCKLKLGGGKSAVVFHFFDPSKAAA